MTTTERPSATRDPRGADLRPYLVALLATGYVLTWFLLDAPVAPSAPPSVGAARPAVAASRPAPSAVWIDELPAGARPVVSLPAGFRIAERGRSDVVATVRSAKAPAPVPRAHRIRTRSS